MTFDEALEAAGVPQAERVAFRVDVRRAWLAVTQPYEVGAVRAVMRGVLTAEEIEAADRLGGERAVYGLLESVGVLP